MMNASVHPARNILTAAVLVAATSTAFAASDGTKGASSSGTANVNANVPAKVKISGLADFDFDTALTTWESGDLTESDTVCVWSSTEAYQVTITTGDGVFELVDTLGAQNNVPYSVGWADEGGTSTGVTYNTALTGQTTTANNQNCTGGDTATLAVTIAGSDLEAARAADYTSTMTITVQSE